ncbi:hypothetical protein [Nocardioides sp. Arc9.136]|uniref:hypothetical protein n=1 Tax=Nocardioides sp. Arc9.136 TaxID=2996826 RepID=UPI00266505FA|nr:hypothetical protein [Nocardioides sp. Arc9.136]WKN49629.1 hypothetical protein OSR43_05720 [Nocardioides sp. Arc9.136]
MPSGARVLLASLAVTGVVVGAGLAAVGPDDAAGPGPSGPQASPTASAPGGPPGLEDVETRGLAALRAPFCSGVAPAAVTDALGGEPTRAESYDNGETAALTPKVTDVAHEHGCSWTSAGSGGGSGGAGTTARAWVFAPPVTAGEARGLADDAAAARGCSAVADAPALGDPGVALVCTRGPVRETSYRGLLGDAWLVCSISAPGDGPTRADQLARTSRWCAAVVTAATGSTVPD